MTPRLSVNAGVLLALGVAGCTTNTAEQQPCPTARIFGPAAEVTKFVPGVGRDLTDVTLEARILQVDGFCTFDLEQDGSGEVTVDMAVLIAASRGPANETRDGRISYFVALTNEDREILRKPVFDTNVNFTNNVSRVEFAEEFALDFALEPGEAAVGYDILVGFQLTPDEVEHNQSRLR